jgi:5-methylcytosine-specific restriction endonuclease McrA
MSVPRRVRELVFERDRYTCRYCGLPITVLRRWHDPLQRWIGLIHLDHIVPKCKGGTDDLKNLVTACQPCNLAKYDREAEPIPLERIHALD